MIFVNIVTLNFKI